MIGSQVSVETTVDSALMVKMVERGNQEMMAFQVGTPEK